MDTQVVGNFHLQRLETFERVEMTAYREAAHRDAEVIPVTLFKQGARYQAAGVMRFGMIARILYSEAAKKGSSLDGIASTSNRPEDPKHTAEIAEYISANRHGKYVLGALTLNARQELTIFTGISDADVQMGYLILPRSAQIAITDGQHRQKAVKRLFEILTPDEQQELGRQGIAVVITNETETDQIHQDFADASKTKPLPPGLLAAYDTRNPANRVVLLLEKHCPLFTGRIDATSKSISKNSPMLFTANQVRSFVKEFIAGSWQLANVDFEKAALKILPTDEILVKEMEKAAAYINRVTASVPVLRRIAELGSGIAAGKIADLRDEDASGGYVCLTASGLVILGKIGHELFKDHPDDWESFADRLGQIAWEKKAAHWGGNIVAPSVSRAGVPILKVLQQQNLIRQAANVVRAQIGLSPEPTSEMAEEPQSINFSGEISQLDGDHRTVVSPALIGA